MKLIMSLLVETSPRSGRDAEAVATLKAQLWNATSTNSVHTVVSAHCVLCSFCVFWPFPVSLSLTLLFALFMISFNQSINRHLSHCVK